MKVTAPLLKEKKKRGEKIVAITAYDGTFAALFDSSQVDFILVGDSLGTVIQGEATTLSVTLDEMVYHCRCVARGVKEKFVVGDLPFLSYQPSVEEALRSAGRLMKEGRVHAVKLEGGAQYADRVKAMVDAGIPVVGHLGLTPQSYHSFGGYKVQAKEKEEQERLCADALALQEAGICALVLECIPASLSEVVTAQLEIPTIGIGAGSSCDGQILVSYDLLGLTPPPYPRFVEPFINLRALCTDAVNRYAVMVHNNEFPEKKHSY